MANITTAGDSDYPTSLDTRSVLTDGSSGSEIVANHPNGLSDAVINIETELGTLPKGSAADVKTRLAEALNDNGSIKSTVIAATSPTAVSYSSGVFTISENRNVYQSGTIVQMRRVVVTGFTTTNGIIPLDNTPPQSSEGSGFGLSVDMKPTSTLNTVYVRGDFNAASSINESLVAALFLAGSSSAVTGTRGNGGAGNLMTGFGFQWRATTVSTATTTYAVNLGVSTAGTLTLNGQASAGLFGDTAASLLTVFEVQN